MQKGFPKPLPKNLKTMIVGEGFPLPLQRIAREAERLPYKQNQSVGADSISARVREHIECSPTNTPHKTRQ